MAPIAFSISINDLNDGTMCALSKFANDSKLGGGFHAQMVVTSFRGTSKGWRKEQRRIHEVQQREKQTSPPE